MNNFKVESLFHFLFLQTNNVIFRFYEEMHSKIYKCPKIDSSFNRTYDVFLRVFKPQVRKYCFKFLFGPFPCY